ncbi:nitric oxide reductase activation protein NorD [Salipiger aestuarii]|uniref:nitric oxide reductase activation protein NorD n=1 Tax=Salipiger aestuarii TaxID=568098 RepID=UPI001CC287CB|nr:VWA domain-containing protein [Salipiger aestuarii]
MPVPDDMVDLAVKAPWPDATLAAFPGESLGAFSAAHARLAGAGYGGEVPRVFATTARQVAERLGPQVALSLGTVTSRVAIKTRPRIAAIYLSTAASMSRDMDESAFLNWQAMMLGLLATAPESVLPLLERMEMLTGRLAPQALSAWIDTGLRLAGRDAARRLAYFRLELPEAQRLLERHAGDETFQSLERGLAAFHTALWGRNVPLREALPDPSGRAIGRASFAAGVVQLPPSLPGHGGNERLLYRAALAHIGAHFAYGGPCFEIGQLKPMQIAVVSLIEDARVETLALRDMPGLRRLWAPFHNAEPGGVATAPSLFTRLARALFDPDFPPEHGWVAKGVDLFNAHRERLADPAISRHIGNLLGNDLGQTRVQFNAKGYVVQPVYRDDNLGLWAFPDAMHQPPAEQIEMPVETRDLGKTDQGGATDHSPQPPADDPPDEAIAIAPSEPTDGARVTQLSEYDYAARIERPDWVTVNRYDPGPGDPRFWDKLTQRHAALVKRTETLVRQANVGRRKRLKRQSEGETLDLDAAISSAIAHRGGQTPDHRVYQGISAPVRSIAVHLLLDTSLSTGAETGAGSVLDLERDAAAILAQAMEQLGDPLAITAFSSCGREDVRTVLVKGFDEPVGMATGMALSGLKPAWSTRIGAGIRLAGRTLDPVPTHRKLVLILTDGEPSDIDVPDPDYLVADAKRAVQSLTVRGIDCFCIALGSPDRQRHSEIFGQNHVQTFENIRALPEKLTEIFFRLSK